MKKRYVKKQRHGNGTNGKKRTNGNGTLEKRGENWLARWYITTSSGEKIRKSQLIKKSDAIPNIEAARQRLNELTKENSYSNIESALLKTQKQLAGIKAEKEAYLDQLPALTISDSWEVFSETRAGRKPSDGTKYMYQCQFNQFKSWLTANHASRLELRHINRSIAREFSDHLLKHFSANTHNKYITLLSCIWDAISRRDSEIIDGLTEHPATNGDFPLARIQLNPWRDIEKEKAVAHTRRELTFDEISKVCKSLSGEMRILFAVGIATGLRLIDCALMDWSKIDLSRGFIKLRPRKIERKLAIRGEWVTIPILPDLHDMLMETPASKRHGYLLPELAEIYLHDSAALSNRISKAFQNCGITTNSKRKRTGRASVDVGFHSLRHTFVSIAAQYKIPLTTVQAIVGHSNPKMTEHYLHISQDTLKQQMTAFPRLLPAEILPHFEQCTETTLRPPEIIEAESCTTRPTTALDALRTILAQIPQSQWGQVDEIIHRHRDQGD